MLLEVKQLTRENTKEYNDKSGIYALLYNDEIIYIGQSKRVGQRLKRHRNAQQQLNDMAYKIKEEQKKDVYIYRDLSIEFYNFILAHQNEIYFLVFLCPIEDLDKIEEYYITKYKPKYNYAGVEGPYIGVKKGE